MRVILIITLSIYGLIQAAGPDPDKAGRKSIEQLMFNPNALILTGDTIKARVDKPQVVYIPTKNPDSRTPEMNLDEASLYQSVFKPLNLEIPTRLLTDPIQ